MKGKMKKLLSILVMAAMVLALAGCSKGGDSKDDSADKETKKSFKVG